MLFVLSFFAGIANFAMQKAVFDSQHPTVALLRRYLGPMGGERFSLVLDFVLLAMVLIFVARGAEIAGWTYLGYTAFNAMAAWAILTDRI